MPDASLLDLKSLKYSLLSYTGVGVVQEHAANQILNDLVESCKLLRMEINLDSKVRGGLHTTVPVRYEKS